eukprot:s728_g44.t1
MAVGTYFIPRPIDRAPHGTFEIALKYYDDIHEDADLRTWYPQDFHADLTTSSHCTLLELVQTLDRDRYCGGPMKCLAIGALLMKDYDRSDFGYERLLDEPGVVATNSANPVVPTAASASSGTDGANAASASSGTDGANPAVSTAEGSGTNGANPAVSTAASAGNGANPAVSTAASASAAPSTESTPPFLDVVALMDFVTKIHKRRLPGRELDEEEWCRTRDLVAQSIALCGPPSDWWCDNDAEYEEVMDGQRKRLRKLED